MKDMINKAIAAAFGCCVFAFVAAVAAYGDTIAVPGGNIEYTGATIKHVGDDVLLVFTNVNADANNTFTIPATMTAKTRLFLVGGGGAGGTVGLDLDRGAGGGGGAGGISDRNVMLDAGSYSVIVGRGGEKAQTSVQSWIGDDGESSAIKHIGSETFIASTKGGGGGGSVKVGGEGTPGASGGGGSWYGDFMPGGNGTESYGWAGGTPVDSNFGGGGGGAAKSGIEGNGGTNGVAGAGRVCDITGEDVTYAQGGRGGRRGDSSYTPADAVGYGFGGDGAVNGLGGAGADGIVIVRISKIFNYKFVDFPTAPVYTNSFVWVDGASYTGLDLAQASDDFRAAIAKVDGVTNVNCSVDGVTTNGLGRFKFTLYLNDEYKWNDGGDGNISPYVCGWRVKEPDVIGEITVEITKKVDWFEGTNATIAIDVHSTPETRMKAPSVLMLGSMCYKHGLTPAIVKTALDTLAKVGNVDYKFFLQVSAKNDPDLTPVYSGHLNVGEEATHVPTEDYSNMHGALYAFYEYLWQAKNSDTEYDYIVLSFDRSKVATTFPGAHPHESEVSAYIKDFYDRGAVIWMVDNEPVDCDKISYSYQYYQNRQWKTATDTATVNLKQTPWYPSPLVYLSAGTSSKWTTFQGYIDYGNSSSTDGETAKANYKALMGIFDPSKYATANSDYDSYNPALSPTGSSNGTEWKNETTNLKNKLAHLSGQTNVNQVVYNDADEVARVLEDVVKPTIATMQLEDHVYLTNGLKIASTEGYWTTNETQKLDTWETAQTDWTRLKPNELTNSDADGVRIAISNVTTDVWLKLKVGVFDTGRFLSSVNATYNEQTGLWEKDPNDGPVTVKMTPDAGTEVLAQDQASTTVEWSFEAFKITGGVVWGEGEFIINGFFTNEISVAKGYNPEVLFRGAPGWAVNYINVDGVVLDEVNYKTNWFFGAISADHDIRVGFTNIVVNPPPPEIGPVVVTYDGTGYAPETTLDPTFAEGYEEYSNHWYMVYTTDPDVALNTAGLDNDAWRELWSRDGVVTNVVLDANGDPQPQTVYARVCLDQPGYENGAICDYWIGTNTVTVLPREVTVKYDDYVRTSSADSAKDPAKYTYKVVDGAIVDGDEFGSDTGICTDYPTKGHTTVDSITNRNDFVVSTGRNGGEDITANYVITVLPGDYIYPDLELVATAPDVVKYYDALATGTVVTVVYPVNAKTVAESTSAWSNWSGAHTDGYTYYNDNGNQVNSESQASKRVRTRTRTRTGSTLTIVYTYNGTSSTTPFEFTDVGLYNVEYTVNYTTINVVETETETNTRSKWLMWWGSWSTDNPVPSSTDTGLTYDEVTGTATITIKPREVTVTAGDAEKVYDGTALTQSAYTIDPADAKAKGDQSGKGFITGEGFASVPMTSASTITLPGTVANVINESAVTCATGTNPDNYNITYVPGTLKVTVNQLTATVSAEDKVYDGDPISNTGLVVKDAGGNPLPADKYTVLYRSKPWGEWKTLEEALAECENAGSYELYCQVTGKDGYGTAECSTIYTISKRPVVLTAASDEKFYDGTPLTNNGVTASPTTENSGFVKGQGITAATMTEASTITKPGKVDNVIDTSTVSDWTFVGGLDANTFLNNYTFTTEEGTLKVTRRTIYEVEGDGEFSWTLDTEDYEGKLDNTVTVVVDGKYTNQVYTLESDVLDRMIHVSDETGDDNATHTIEFIFSDEYDESVFVNNTHWEPAADEDEVMYLVVNTDPPTEVEEAKMYIDIVNGPESGWMPLYTTNAQDEVEVALRSPDGTEPVNTTGGEGLDSKFTLGVTGSGEITVSRIIIPVDDEANIDDGQLTIWVDNHEYKIPPVPDDTVDYSIVTNGHQIIISNLVIQVTGDSTNEHSVVFQYTREATNEVVNTAAIVEKIIWRTYGETDDGGSSWLEGKALWIIDHEDPGNGWIYLAFEPELKVKEEIEYWVSRSDAKNMIRVKYGRTLEAMQACDPVVAHLSDKPGHEIKVGKVWIKVSMEDMNKVTIVEPVGFWKIFIDGPAIALSGTEGHESETVEDPNTKTAEPAMADPVSDDSPAQESDLVGEGAVSINTFGILKIERATTNTMIAVPWTWYSKFQNEAQNIPVKKLVKTTNLEAGDMLLAPVNNDTYAAWTVVCSEQTDEHGKVFTNSEWSAVQVIRVDQDGYGRMDFVADDDEDDEDYSHSTRIARGNGLWLTRQKPLDAAGNIRPFWVYGQSVTTEVTTVISAPTGDATVCSTMIGNPYAQDVVLNDLVFEGTINTEDRIKIHTTEGVNRELVYVNGKGWRELTTRIVNGVKRNVYVYSTVIPAGSAFWYDRRGKEDLRITWPLPSAE